MDPIKPDTFCAYPFLQVFFNENGTSFPCCDSVMEVYSHQELASQLVSADQGINLNDAWNAPVIRQLRKDIMQAKRSPACRRCFFVEDSGSTSIRNMVNNALASDALKIAESVDKDGFVTRAPQMLDLRLGNLCNLKCRMCHPGFSVSLIEEYNEIHNTDFSSQQNIDWFKKPGFLENLADSCGEIRKLHVAGGEPFIIPEYKKLLELLIAKGLAKNIALSLSTNITNFNESILKLFPHFRGVEIVVSIDGYDKINEYIRYPSNFDRIVQNLLKLHERMEEFGIEAIRFNTTVQAYNIFDIPNIIRFLSKSFPKFEWCPKLNMLISPEPLSSLVLPLDIRTKVKDQLQNFIKDEVLHWQQLNDPKSKVTLETIRKEVDGVISYLDGPNHSHLYPEFLRMTEIFDRNRGQSLNHTIPEICI